MDRLKYLDLVYTDKELKRIFTKFVVKYFGLDRSTLKIERGENKYVFSDKDQSVELDSFHILMPLRTSEKYQDLMSDFFGKEYDKDLHDYFWNEIVDLDKDPIFKI